MALCCLDFHRCCQREQRCRGVVSYCNFIFPTPTSFKPSRFLWSLISSVDCSSRRCPLQYTEAINIRRFEGSGCRNGETTVSNKAGGTTHYTLEEFREMYEAILDCLTAISNDESNKWSFKTMTDVFGLLCGISSSAFTAAFQVSRCMFEDAVGLSKLFQGSTQDIIGAYKEVALVWTSFSTSDKLQIRSTMRSTRRLQRQPRVGGASVGGATTALPDDTHQIIKTSTGTIIRFMMRSSRSY